MMRGAKEGTVHDVGASKRRRSRPGVLKAGQAGQDRIALRIVDRRVMFSAFIRVYGWVLQHSALLRVFHRASH